MADHVYHFKHGWIPLDHVASDEGVTKQAATDKVGHTTVGGKKVSATKSEGGHVHFEEGRHNHQHAGPDHPAAKAFVPAKEQKPPKSTEPVHSTPKPPLKTAASPGTAAKPTDGAKRAHAARGTAGEFKPPIKDNYGDRYGATRAQHGTMQAARNGDVAKLQKAGIEVKPGDKIHVDDKNIDSTQNPAITVESGDSAKRYTVNGLGKAAWAGGSKRTLATDKPEHVATIPGDAPAAKPRALRTNGVDVAPGAKVDYQRKYGEVHKGTVKQVNDRSISVTNDQTGETHRVGSHQILGEAGKSSARGIVDPANVDNLAPAAPAADAAPAEGHNISDPDGSHRAQNRRDMGYDVFDPQGAGSAAERASLNAKTPEEHEAAATANRVAAKAYADAGAPELANRHTSKVIDHRMMAEQIRNPDVDDTELEKRIKAEEAGSTAPAVDDDPNNGDPGAVADEHAEVARNASAKADTSGSREDHSAAAIAHHTAADAYDEAADGESGVSNHGAANDYHNAADEHRQEALRHQFEVEKPATALSPDEKNHAIAGVEDAIAAEGDDPSGIRGLQSTLDSTLDKLNNNEPLEPHEAGVLSDLLHTTHASNESDPSPDPNPSWGGQPTLKSAMDKVDSGQLGAKPGSLEDAYPDPNTAPAEGQNTLSTEQSNNITDLLREESDMMDEDGEDTADLQNAQALVDSGHPLNPYQAMVVRSVVENARDLDDEDGNTENVDYYNKMLEDIDGGVLGSKPQTIEHGTYSPLQASAGLQADGAYLSTFAMSTTELAGLGLDDTLFAVTAKERKKAADKGQAMGDGSYPIRNRADLTKAIRIFPKGEGNGKTKDGIKRHIIERARSLKAIKRLPDTWGVTAAGASVVNADNPDTPLTDEEIFAFVAAALTEVPPTEVPDGVGGGVRFRIPLLVPTGIETGDRREFTAGGLTSRDFPMPLYYQTLTDEGHKNSVIVGRIDHAEKVKNGIGNAVGEFDTGDQALEALRLARNLHLRGVSADMDKTDAEATMSEQDGKPKVKFGKARLTAATMVGKPAFAECQIELPGDEEWERNMSDFKAKYGDKDVKPLVAAGGPIVPPRTWFDNPNLTEPTHLTVEDDGRVFGHIAAWGIDHIGMPFQQAPKSRSGYRYFATGQVKTDDGSLLNVGQLTLAGGHADTSLSAQMAIQHYDDTNSAVADVAIGEDQFGIWVAGAQRPDLTEAQVRQFRASDSSGDWRPIGGALELVACCQVNCAGFPIPRARVVENQVLALTAAGAAVVSRNAVHAAVDAATAATINSEFQTRIARLESIDAGRRADVAAELRATVASAKTALLESTKASLVASGQRIAELSGAGETRPKAPSKTSTPRGEGGAPRLGGLTQGQPLGLTRGMTAAAVPHVYHFKHGWIPIDGVKISKPEQKGWQSPGNSQSEVTLHGEKIGVINKSAGGRSSRTHDGQIVQSMGGGKGYSAQKTSTGGSLGGTHRTRDAAVADLVVAHREAKGLPGGSKDQSITNADLAPAPTIKRSGVPRMGYSPKHGQIRMDDVQVGQPNELGRKAITVGGEHAGTVFPMASRLHVANGVRPGEPGNETSHPKQDDAVARLVADHRIAKGGSPNMPAEPATPSDVAESQQEPIPLARPSRDSHGVLVRDTGPVTSTSKDLPSGYRITTDRMGLQLKHNGKTIRTGSGHDELAQYAHDHAAGDTSAHPRTAQDEIDAAKGNKRDEPQNVATRDAIDAHKARGLQRGTLSALGIKKGDRIELDKDRSGKPAGSPRTGTIRPTSGGHYFTPDDTGKEEWVGGTASKFHARKLSGEIRNVDTSRPNSEQTGEMGPAERSMHGLPSPISPGASSPTMSAKARRAFQAASEGDHDWLASHGFISPSGEKGGPIKAKHDSNTIAVGDPGDGFRFKTHVVNGNGQSSAGVSRGPYSHDELKDRGYTTVHEPRGDGVASQPSAPPPSPGGGEEPIDSDALSHKAWGDKPWSQIPADYRSTTGGVKRVLVNGPHGTTLVPWHGDKTMGGINARTGGLPSPISTGASSPMLSAKARRAFQAASEGDHKWLGAHGYKRNSGSALTGEETFHADATNNLIGVQAPNEPHINWHPVNGNGLPGASNRRQSAVFNDTGGKSPTPTSQVVHVPRGDGVPTAMPAPGSNDGMKDRILDKRADAPDAGVFRAPGNPDSLGNLRTPSPEVKAKMAESKATSDADRHAAALESHPVSTRVHYGPGQAAKPGETPTAPIGEVTGHTSQGGLRVKMQGGRDSVLGPEQVTKVGNRRDWEDGTKEVLVNDTQAASTPDGGGGATIDDGVYTQKAESADQAVVDAGPPSPREPGYREAVKRYNDAKHRLQSRPFGSGGAAAPKAPAANSR